MTGLDWNVVDVQFDRGLNTKVNSKLVIPGKWTQLQNLTLSKDNTLRRRDGFQPLVSSPANALATFNDELLLVSSTAVSSVSTAANTAASVDGVFGNVLLTKEEVNRGPGNLDSLDCAYGAGLTCYVWRDYGPNNTPINGINVTLVDEATGAKLIDNGVVAGPGATTVFSPRVVFADSAFFITWGEPATGIWCSTILVSAPTQVNGAVNVIISGGISNNFDAVAWSTASGKVLVAYADSSGFSDVAFAATLQRTAAVPSVQTGPIAVLSRANVVDADVQGFACVPYGDGLFAGIFILASASGGGAINGTVGVVVSPSLAIHAAATVIDSTTLAVASQSHVTACADSASGTDIYVFTDEQSSYGTNNVRTVRKTGVDQSLSVIYSPTTLANSNTFRGTAAGDAAGPQGPFISGKAFAVGGRFYLPVCVMENYDKNALTSTTVDKTTTDNAQCCFFLLDASQASSSSALGVVLAKALYGTLGLLDPTLGAADPTVATPCSTPNYSAGGTSHFLLALQERSADLQIANNANITPVGACRLLLDVNNDRGQSTAQLGETTLFAGGSMSAYDGSAMGEQGFYLYPEGINVVVTAPGGAAKLTPGVHQLVAAYDFIDAAGLRTQSAASPPVSVTVTNATDLITVKIPTLQLSQRNNLGISRPVGISVYMTEAGALTFRRVINVATPWLNDTSLAFVTLTIGSPTSATDAFLVGNELLYTQPLQESSALANISPPPCSAMAVHQNRLFIDAADDPGVFWFSQPVSNMHAVYFNDALSRRLPVAAGDIVGFESMDEKLIIFCSNGLFGLFGTGPNAAGLFDNYSQPQALPSDVGCVERRSILKMPHGIIFKSAKGWYILGRDLSVRFIGDGVDGFNANDVTSAVMMGDRQECRFSSTSGTQLFYTYDLMDPDGAGQWSTAVGVFSHEVVDALYWRTTGRYITANTIGTVNTDTPGQYVDTFSGNATKITTVARTSFLHLGAMETFQRVRRMYLTAASETGLQPMSSSLAIAVDYDDQYGQVAPGASTTTVSMATVVPPGNLMVNAMDVRLRLPRQKCKSVSFTFTETPSDDNGTGLLTGMQAMALEIGSKRGVNKLPARATV